MSGDVVSLEAIGITNVGLPLAHAFGAITVADSVRIRQCVMKTHVSFHTAKCFMPNVESVSVIGLLGDFALT